MKIATKNLLEEMRSITEWAIRTVSEFRAMDIVALQRKPSPDSWSALECLDHLCQYGDHYLPAMGKNLLGYKGGEGPDKFHTGVVGGYFAGLMKAGNGRVTLMKAPKDKLPSSSAQSITTVERFLKQQEELLRLLELARSTNLRHVHVPTSLSPLIRLRLGDTFRFYVYHIERHVLQAQRALSLG